MPAEYLSYTADLSPEVLHRDISAVVAPVVPTAPAARIIASLGELFALYLSLYPYGLWAPGLVVTEAMREETELLLPLGAIRRHLNRYCRQALLLSCPDNLPLLDSAPSWLDALQRLPSAFQIANPARLLRLVQDDLWLRTCLLFALHVPAHHGETFDRYPLQLDLIAQWLRQQKPETTIRCLDAACGTGEGSYELALLLQGGGFGAHDCRIDGVSLDPLEVFAAAHCFFPHDPEKQSRVCRVAGEVLSRGAQITFSTGDITAMPASGEEQYNLVVCNGVLGGPFLHERERLEKAVSWLTGRLELGGVILAADRFHGGWKKKAPPRMLAELFRARGVVPWEVSDGFAGVKIGGEPMLP